MPISGMTFFMLKIYFNFLRDLMCKIMRFSYTFAQEITTESDQQESLPGQKS